MQHCLVSSLEHLTTHSSWGLVGMEGDGVQCQLSHKTSWVSSRDNTKRLIFLLQQTPVLQLLLLEQFCHAVRKRAIWLWPLRPPKLEKPLAPNCLTLSLSSSCRLIPCPFQGSWTFCKQIVWVTGAGKGAATGELWRTSGILWPPALSPESRRTPDQPSKDARTERQQCRATRYVDTRERHPIPSN